MQTTLKISVLLLYLLSQCFIFFQESGAISLNKLSKPKAVNLAHTCIKVTTDTNRSNDGTTILLLHGATDSKETWKGIPQVLALKTGRRVCAADLRNHGDSPWSDELGVAAMTEDITELLHTIKSPKIIILGHSLGGKTALHFTLNNPEKVQKLIVEDMRPNSVDPLALEITTKHYLPLLEEALTAIPEGADERIAKQAVAEFLNSKLNLIQANFTGVDPDILPIRCGDGKCAWKTNPKVFKQFQNESMLIESSGLFTGPTLFIYGTLSPFKINEDEDSIRKLFPNSMLVGIEGASHDVHHHREFLDEVIKFINE